MSETTLFGDDSMTLKTSYSNPRVVAEAYQAVSNTYGDACNEAPELKDYLSLANSEIGQLQGNMDNMKASDVSTFRHFDVKDHNGHKVFESYTPEIESDFHAADVVSQIQEQLRESLAEVELAAPSGGSSEPESDDNDDSGNDDVNNLEGPFQQLAQHNGLGEATVQKVREAIVTGEIDIPSHEEIDMEVSVTEQYDSLDEVPAETVAELTPEQISELQG